jgi:hypothetical protein
VRINDWQLERTNEHTCLSATIDGRELWYRFPSAFQVPRPGDALVAAVLLPAMLTGEPLELDSALAVSPRLFAGLDAIQTVFIFLVPGTLVAQD